MFEHCRILQRFGNGFSDVSVFPSLSCGIGGVFAGEVWDVLLLSELGGLQFELFVTGSQNVSSVSLVFGGDKRVGLGAGMVWEQLCSAGERQELGQPC